MKPTIKITLSAFAIGIIFALWTAGTYYFGKRSMPIIEKNTVDTVVIRETIRDTILVPKVKYLARVDTVFLSIPGDTVRVKVEVPIERKVYQTEDYRATVEGFRPNLVDMEIYRQTQFITQTQTIKVPDKRRWGIGLHAGYGYTPKGFQPYIGVGINYNIITW